MNNSKIETCPILLMGILLVSVAAIYRGGNRWLPITLLEWLSIALLMVMLFHWQYHKNNRMQVAISMSRTQTMVLATIMSSPLWIAGLQLLPLSVFSGGGEPIETSLAHSSEISPLAMASALPVETMQAVLVSIPMVCCFALALYLQLRGVKLLLRVWVLTAIVQAIIGLAQLVVPELGFSEMPIQASQGSFGSRNNFANYLAMLLPLLLLWTLHGADRSQVESQRKMRLLWASALLLILAALIASSSRAGIATGLLVLLLAWAFFIEPRAGAGSSRTWSDWINRLLPLLLALFAMAAGGWDWLKRYETGDPLRLFNWAATWQAAQFYWPFGSGLGSFASVYPTFQPPELGVWFVNFAHNDYLQLLMEAGVLALPVIVLVVGLVLHRCFQLTCARQRAPWSSNDAMAVACGMGFLAQALHAWVDYPWRIPATAMLGAFLLGAFLKGAEKKPHGPSEP